MYTLKQVGNSKTIGYTFSLFNKLYKTHFYAPYFAPPRLLRPGANGPLCPPVVTPLTVRRESMPRIAEMDVEMTT